MSDFDVQAGISLDESTLNGLGQRIAVAVARGFEFGTSGGANKSMDDLVKKVRRDFDSIGKSAIGGATKAAAGAAKEFSNQSARAKALTEDLLADQEAIGRVLRATSKIKFVDPDNLAVINQVLERLQRVNREVRNLEPGDDNAFRNLRAEADNLKREALSNLAVFRRVADQASATNARAENERIAIASAAARERLQILRAESAAANNEAQRKNTLEIAAAKTAGAQRVAITQATAAALLNIERGLIRALTGIARTGVGAISKIYQSTFGSITRVVTSHNRTINTNTATSLSQRQSLISRAFSREEQTIRSSLSRQQAAIQSAQTKINAGVVGAASRSSLLGGLAAGGGIGALLTSGFERASILETLNKQFIALTGSATEAAQITAQVTDFARITPFDLTGVSLLAKGFLQIGKNADEIIPSIAAITDAVALTGGGTTELERIQRAIGQVVSAGRLQGDELNQLAENLPGLNIRQILADQLTGGDTAALVALQEAGEISGDTFVSALLEGLESDPRLKFATLAAADSLKGRLDNLKEGFADVGAAFIQQISGPLKSGFTFFTGFFQTLAQVIRGEELTGRLEIVRDALKGIGIGLAAVVAAKGAVEVLQLAGKAAVLLGSPLGVVALAVIGLSTAFSVLNKRSEGFREFVENVRGKLEGFAETAGKFAEGALAKIGSFLESSVLPALSKFASFLGDVASGVGAAAVDFFNTKLVPAFSAASIALVSFTADGVEYFLKTWVKVGPTVTGIVDRVKGAIGQLGDTIGNLSGGALAGAGAVGLIATAVLGPVGALLVGGAALVGTTFKDEIVKGLESVGEEIVGFFKGIDFAALAIGALDFVERVGFIIGNIASDPRFLAGLALIAAAGLAVGGKFLLGIVKGIIENLPELASIGGKLVEVILDNLAISAPIIGLGIAAVLFGPAALAAITTKAKAVGNAISTAISSGLRGAITGTGSGLAAGIGNILSPKDFIANIGLTSQALTKDLGTATKLLGDGLRSGLRSEAISGAKVFASTLGSNIKSSFLGAGSNLGLSVGQQVGASITAGIGSAISGQQLGKGNKLVGIGGILSSSLVGLAVGGPVVGAAVAGLGLLTAGITAQSEAAKKTKAEIQLYVDAIIAAGGASSIAGQQAIKDSIFTNLQKEATATIDALALAGVGVDQFFAIASGPNAVSAASGIGAVAKSFNDLQVANINQSPGAPRVAAQLAEDLAALSATSPAAGAAVAALYEQFQDGAISSKAFSDALDALKDETNEIATGVGRASVLQGLKADGDDAANSFTLAGARYTAMAEAMQKKEDFEALTNAETQAAEVRNRLEEARNNLFLLLNPTAGTFESELNNLKLQLDGFASGISSGLGQIDAGSVILGQAQIDDTAESFRSAIGTAIEEGVADNLSAAEIEAQLAGLVFAVDELDVPQEVKDSLNAEIAAALEGNAIELLVEANEAQAAQEGEAAGGAFAAGAGGVSLNSTGKNLMASLATGIEKNVYLATQAGRAAAAAVEMSVKDKLLIASPSKVMTGIGQNIGEGLAAGIKQSTAEATKAAADMAVETAEAVVEGLRNGQFAIDQENKRIADSLASNLTSAQVEAFSKLFGSGGGIDAARRGVSSSFLDVSQQGEEAGLFKGLDLGRFGIENRETIASAIDQIKSFGEALLESGASAQTVASELDVMRETLFTTATSAGFNADELRALFDTLGFGVEPIRDLVKATSEAAAGVQKEADEAAKLRAAEDALAEARKKAGLAADALSAEEEATAARGNVQINNSFVLPYGDMEAVASTVSNRQAADLGRRVR